MVDSPMNNYFLFLITHCQEETYCFVYIYIFRKKKYVSSWLLTSKSWYPHDCELELKSPAGRSSPTMILRALSICLWLLRNLLRAAGGGGCVRVGNCQSLFVIFIFYCCYVFLFPVPRESDLMDDLIDPREFDGNLSVDYLYLFWFY